eukprot:CAMPEP_0116929956 /NCGR_PEP_ID=MMETSP0467-20121206/26900_1 /TAXON_ID=283647 /ORGANISM="Mesodinium pulex, Strain SPMC105" /LENGTH=107 /DNA_ID=CAMNT_0004610045 /DNA_START=165 /DNA_END=484 /DNA_ORIENTATION=+
MTFLYEFMQEYKHKDIPDLEKPMINPFEQQVSEFDQTFFAKLSPVQLIEMINLSNFLNYEPVIEMCCAKLADIVGRNDVESIRTMFHIENDFTPEEIEEIKNEHKWA